MFKSLKKIALKSEEPDGLDSTPEGVKVEEQPVSGEATNADGDLQSGQYSDSSSTRSTSQNRIKEMQQEIIALKNDLQGTGLKKGGEQTTKDAFLKFMLEQYAADSKEYAVDSGKPYNEQYAERGVDYKDSRKNLLDTKDIAKAQKALDLTKVLSQMSIVGPHAANVEESADGDWGPYTNTSLNNVKVFAEAMVKFQKDLGLQEKTYSQGDLEQLKANVPAKDANYSPTQKVKSSGILADNIKKLRALVKDFEANVFTKYKDIIDQKKSFPSSIGASEKPTKPLISVDNSKQVKEFDNAISLADGYIQNMYEGMKAKGIIIDEKNKTVTLPSGEKKPFDKNLIDLIEYKQNLQQKRPEPSVGKLSNQEQIDIFNSVKDKDLYNIPRTLGQSVDSSSKDRGSLKIADLVDKQAFKKFLQREQITYNNIPASSNSQLTQMAFKKIKELIDSNQVYINM